MLDPKTARTLLAPLEDLLNRRIAASSAATSQCARLEGRTLAMRIRDTSLTLYFHAGADRLTLSAEYDDDPDAFITGTPIAFAAFARPADDSRVASGLKFEGDPETARAFQALFRLARPDFEEELSRFVGDVAAHKLGNFARAAGEFGRRALASLGETAADYVKEESRDVVTRYEIDEFADDVDAVSAALADAERRVDAVTGNGTGD